LRREGGGGERTKKGGSSLGVMREDVREISSTAFYGCLRITTLKGLPKNLRTINYRAFGRTGITSLKNLPSKVTMIHASAFAYCAALTSIGPGFSPDCYVHRLAFYKCPAVLKAARVKGFDTAIEWGKHHWFVVDRRFTVFSAVRQVRPFLPDAVVRVIMEFGGMCG